MSTVAEPKNSLAQRLESSINRDTAGGIDVSSKAGMMIRSMAEAMEFAKLMALARVAVPAHLRENPGACLALVIQAAEWNISPFALAGKSYSVNDRLCFEASLYHAVVTRRAPIKGRVKPEYAGEGETRTCRVWATLADGTGDVEYTSPKFGKIQPKNSPLWKNDPDQQLFYFSVRAFARRHFPDVMMGIYTVDEMQDNSEALTAVVETRPKTDRLADRLIPQNAIAKEPSLVIVPESDSVVESQSEADSQSQDWDERLAEQIESATKPDQLDAIQREVETLWNDGKCDGAGLLAMIEARRVDVTK